MAHTHKTLTRRRKSLDALARSLDSMIERKWSWIPPPMINQVIEEVEVAAADLPGLLPSFQPENLKHEKQFTPDAVRAFLGRCIAAVDSELDEDAPATVIGPMLDFRFVSNAQIRAIVERDYPELLTAFSASCRKSSLVLAGSIIEALLLDYVLQNLSAAVASQSAPKSNDPLRWTLEDLINVSVELRPTLAPVQTMSHGVREYRNLVHPAVEMRKPLRVELEEARVAVSLVAIIHRELS
jgi:hypothetical protein